MLSLALLTASACVGPQKGKLETPSLEAPAQLSDLDDFAAARNAFALMPVGDPQRAALREQLRDYVVGYVDEALGQDRSEAAIAGLEQLCELWTASELQQPRPDPAIAELAGRVYASVAPAGDEHSALLALALQQHFGDAQTSAEAEAGYAQLQDWIERSEGFTGDPRYGALLDRLLEDASSVFPSPFLTRELTGSYLAQFRRAQTEGISDPRTAYTGYLVARAHLRADDPAAAVAAMEQMEIDEAAEALRELIRDATLGAKPSPPDIAQLMREFLPAPDHQLPPSIVRQSWGIVDNLARMALADAPDDAAAHLARGRVLRYRGLVPAAILHYEQAFAAKGPATDREDLHLAWSELAGLLQLELEDAVRTTQGDPEGDAQVDAALERVQDFHERAAKVWPLRPVSPGLNVAWMTVALRDFDRGRPDQAESLLSQAVQLEPHPLALSLLGTIALRRGQLEVARDRVSSISELPFPDQLDRYDWQIQSQMQLAEIERFADDPGASVEHLREALRQLNTLIAYPGLAAPQRVDYLTRRAQVFFALGELELAMKDFRAAHNIAPGRASTYSPVLIFAVTHGHLGQAREILSAALGSEGTDDELAVYYALWVIDLCARQGAPVPEDAQAHLAALVEDPESDPWSQQLARHGLGQLDGDALIAAAGQTRQRSEAFFYAGLQRWRGGETEASLELMRKVLEAQMIGDFEYEMAQSYLRWQELPKAPRAADMAIPPTP